MLQKDRGFVLTRGGGEICHIGLALRVSFLPSGRASGLSTLPEIDGEAARRLIWAKCVTLAVKSSNISRGNRLLSPHSLPLSPSPLLPFFSLSSFRFLPSTASLSVFFSSPYLSIHPFFLIFLPFPFSPSSSPYIPSSPHLLFSPSSPRYIISCSHPLFSYSPHPSPFSPHFILPNYISLYLPIFPHICLPLPFLISLSLPSLPYLSPISPPPLPTLHLPLSLPLPSTPLSPSSSPLPPLVPWSSPLTQKRPIETF